MWGGGPPRGGGRADHGASVDAGAAADAECAGAATCTGAVESAPAARPRLTVSPFCACALAPPRVYATPHVLAGVRTMRAATLLLAGVVALNLASAAAKEDPELQVCVCVCV